MARTARVKSTSGTYHVLLRSKDEPLFCDEADATEFLQILLKEKTGDFAEIYSYCIFEHYVHLVIKEGLSSISKNIMRLCSLYGKYYNAKYGLQGRLFRDRFKSEPLDEMNDILECTRYVHRLPIECGYSIDYDFSSYKNYFSGSELLSSQEVVQVIGSQIDYKIYCDEKSSKEFLSILNKRKK